MSKKARQQRKHDKPKQKSRGRRQAILVIGLILCLGVTGVILARWKATNAITTTNAMLTAPPPAPTPSSFSPSNPSKEYIYAGGKLVATEEPGSAGAATAATFIKADNTSQGTWKGTYGSDGHHIIGDTISYPSYAQVTNSGTGLHTWASSTSDGRALQKAASTTDRIAACWYSFYANGITEINITDGQTHQLAVYALDWDGNNARSETIDILDAATNTVLSSQPVQSFSNGRYLVWNISGHVKVRVTDSGAVGTAVISGLFFDPLPAPVNHALAANGGVATASSAYSGFAPSGAINGDRKGLGAWQNGYWSAAGPGYPAWLQVDFSSSKTINEIDVFNIQDNYANPVEPTETMTFTGYGIVDFQVQYWDGAAWVTVPGGSVTGNNKVWRKFTFSPITTTKIRVYVTGAADSYGRATELEAWGTN